MGVVVPIRHRRLTGNRHRCAPVIRVVGVVDGAFGCRLLGQAIEAIELTRDRPVRGIDDLRDAIAGVVGVRDGRCIVERDLRQPVQRVVRVARDLTLAVSVYDDAYYYAGLACGITLMNLDSALR